MAALNRKMSPFFCFSNHVEELFSKAVELGALKRERERARDCTEYYNIFKAEVRKPKETLNSTSSNTSITSSKSAATNTNQCNAATRDEQSDIGEVKTLLQQ